MHVLLVTLGSSGDVHPFVGLGAELRRRGHRATLVTNAHFEPAALREGLAFLPIGTASDYRRTVENPRLWHPRGGLAVIAAGIVATMRLIYDAIAANSAPDTVVAASTLSFGARIAQEKLGLPLATVHLQPSVLRTASEFPVLPGVPAWRHPPAYVVKAFFALVDRVFIDPLFAKAVDAMRSDLGLPRVRRFFGNWLHSPDLVVGLFPEWFAAPKPDWPRPLVLAGFTGYDGGRGNELLPPEVERFLAAGEPPVVFTPGTAMIHGHDFFQAAVEACGILKRRGLLLTEHEDHLPARLPPTVAHASYVPFGRLLPRVAALVHHGGIGTTSQALAAGIPQLVMPMGFDQPDNAARLERLGVGAALPPSRWTGRAVARRLAPLLVSESTRSSCRELSRRIDFGKSTARAADAIETLAPR